MNFLRKLLAVLLFILVLVIGTVVYITGGNPFSHLGMSTQQNTQSVQPSTGQNKAIDNRMQIPGNQMPQGQKSVNVVLQPDLKAYIDEINMGISLINEANGLITADSFFTDPPKVALGKVGTAPTDKLVPKERTLPVVVLPDGTYQIVGYGQGDMEQAHRGIYKLGQGMTVLNTVLERMNQDIKNNNFPPSSSNSRYPMGMQYDAYGNWYYPGASSQATYPGSNNMYGMGNTQNMNGMYGQGNYNQGITSMPGMAGMPTSGIGTSGLLTGGTVSNVIGIILVGFVILIFVAIFGYVFSIFKEAKPEV